MNKLGTIARVVLGLIFFVSALNAFFNFFAQPPLAPRGVEFITGIVATGYLMPIIKAVEIFAGVLLLTNVAVPFALAILAPIAINIFFFHLILSPSGLPLAILIIALMAFLTYLRRDAFRPLFK